MERKNTRRLFTVTTALLVFSTPAAAADSNGTGNNGNAPAIQQEPGAAAFVDRLSRSLPGFWTVKSGTVNAKANRGDAVDPRWVYRLQFTLSPTADLYTAGQSTENATFLKPAETQGAEKTLYARGEATFEQGDWSLEFTKAESPMSDGKPMGMFPGRTLVVGSKAAQRFKDKRMQNALADYRRDLEAKHERLETRLDKEMADLKDEQAADLKELKAEKEQELAKIEAEHEKRLERLRTKLSQTREVHRLTRRLAKERQKLAATERDAKDRLQATLKARSKVAQNLVAAVKSDNVSDALATFETVRGESGWMAAPVVAAGLKHSAAEVRREAVKLAYAKGDIATKRRAIDAVIDGRWTGDLTCPDDDWTKDVIWSVSTEENRIAGTLRTIDEDGDTDRRQMVVKRIVNVGTQAPLMVAETLDEDAFDYHLRYDPDANAIVGRSNGEDNCPIRMTRPGGRDSTTGQAADLETHTVLIVSDDINGRTSYTIDGGGLIAPIDDETVNEHDISFNSAQDLFHNRFATGNVSNGNDGYRVHGDVPNIELEDPSNARVVVDGDTVETTD